MTSGYPINTHSKLPSLLVTYSQSMGRIYVHDYYLGMDLDFSETGNIKVLMINYMGEILQAFSKELKSTSATLLTDHLFQVTDQDKVKLLPEEQAELFHHFVAQ